MCFHVCSQSLTHVYMVITAGIRLLCIHCWIQLQSGRQGVTNNIEGKGQPEQWDRAAFIMGRCRVYIHKYHLESFKHYLLIYVYSYSNCPLLAIEVIYSAKLTSKWPITLQPRQCSQSRLYYKIYSCGTCPAAVYITRPCGISTYVCTSANTTCGVNQT